MLNHCVVIGMQSYRIR